jgi:hypothetical protein
MVPVNPLTAVTVTVEVVLEPAWMDTDVGLVAKVKSVTMKLTWLARLREPLVPVTVTKYEPTEPPQNSVEVWLGPKTMLVAFNVQVSPVSETDEVRVMVPVKPLTGATVMVEVPTAPAVTVIVVGLATMLKFGCEALLLNLAVWTVSGTDTVVPFAKLTQTPPATLVWEQPVWKPRLMPEVVAVTLYIAVNRSPVVGAEVKGEPTAEAAAMWSVSAVSVLEQTGPRIRRPCRQTRRIVGVPINTVPVKS